MVRTVKSHNKEEEEVDHEFVSRTTDGSFQKEGKSGDRRAKANRSKHSETEQRRRSKINERFQILRDLIPENDQKRDKASFLLEVIQYIQFLQEKVQMYEGTYQGWSPESSKLIPWSNDIGPAESFIDQSQLVMNGSVEEGNIVITPAILTNAQNMIYSNFSEEAACKATDQGAATPAPPLNIPLQTNLFGGATVQPSQGSFSDAEHFASQSRSPIWHARLCAAEYAAPVFNPYEQEDLTLGNGDVSDACSLRLLNTLTHALESSGVNLPHKSISVQLDIGKRTSCGRPPVALCTKDHDNSTPNNQAVTHYRVGSDGDNPAHKRIRTEQSL